MLKHLLFFVKSMRIYIFNIDNMLAKKLFYSLKSKSSNYIVPTLRLRTGAAAGRSNPMSKEQWLHGRRRA